MFPLSEDQVLSDSDLVDLQGTLSPGKPMFAARTVQKKFRKDSLSVCVGSATSWP